MINPIYSSFEEDILKTAGGALKGYVLPTGEVYDAGKREGT